MDFNNAFDSVNSVQDICVKCIDACNVIVDRSLEHSGWLGRRAPLVLASAANSNHTEFLAQTRLAGKRCT